MKAYVISTPGGAERLELRDVPIPKPGQGWVLIKNKAFGLNRSEWFTRNGDSPSVKFPRILGIECTGEVVEAPGTDLKPGDKVAAMMGGMGREFDGSYAEYVCTPRQHVFRINTGLGWTEFAALPEMLQTTHGSLTTGLAVERGQRLLVRGATSSIGYAALAMAKHLGLSITATSRRAGNEADLLAAGAAHVLIDDGKLSEQLRKRGMEPFDRILELIGTKTLLDSMACARPGGIVCMTGILGGEWEIPRFRPMEMIPTGVRLTSYSGGSSDITETGLQQYISLVESGKLQIKLGKVFPFAALPDAHRVMDRNEGQGKLVIAL